MLCRYRSETARIAVAVVGEERELASAEDYPPGRVLPDIDVESDRARITRSCSGGVGFFELRLEPPAQRVRCTRGGLVLRTR